MAWRITGFQKPTTNALQAEGRIPIVHEFQCEFVSDIPNLPTNLEDVAWGSMCFCTEDASLWVLGSNGVWGEVG